ncbi:hypothetical protein B484DRAFT_476558 [Ochromonadaceae sp. CCMP2298]|nr:hypothetical protein B484DRAFT_476558 [Ochromonadaceae sp. CCMP2298]
MWSGLRRPRWRLARTVSSLNGSSTFKPLRKDLIDVLNRFGTDIREKSPGQFELRECKLCDKGNRDALDNLWKLTVWENGGFNCFRCSTKGNWTDLKEASGRVGRAPGARGGSFTALKPSSASSSTFSSTSSSAPTSSSSASDSEPKAYVIPNQAIYKKAQSSLFDPPQTGGNGFERRVSQAQQDQARKYLNEVRGINDTTLLKYSVGVAVQQYLNDVNEWVDHVCVTFPWVVHVAQSDLHGAVFASAADKEAGGGGGGGGSLIARMKYRSLQTKGLQRILPKGGMWGFFGWQLTPASVPPVPGRRAIVITEGEYDAMAVSQALDVFRNDNTLPESLKDVQAVSLPNGCNSLPADLVALLRPYDRIYLWLDGDRAGQDAAEKFAVKLGAHRCMIVKAGDSDENPPKDANDALRRDPLLVLQMLTAARSNSQQHIQSFAQLRSSVRQEVAQARQRVLRAQRAAAAALAALNGGDPGVGGDVGGAGVLEEEEWEEGYDGGTAVSSLPQLTAICKGFRRGELVVFTGPTGSGKTTLLSQMSVDFAQQGKPTLWGSFEIKNVRLMSKLLQQAHKQAPLHELDADRLERVMTDFEDLPLRFLNFHGATDIDQSRNGKTSLDVSKNRFDGEVGQVQLRFDPQVGSYFEDSQWHAHLRLKEAAGGAGGTGGAGAGGSGGVDGSLRTVGPEKKVVEKARLKAEAEIERRKALPPAQLAELLEREQAAKEKAARKKEERAIEKKQKVVRDMEYDALIESKRGTGADPPTIDAQGYADGVIPNGK